MQLEFEEWRASQIDRLADIAATAPDPWSKADLQAAIGAEGACGFVALAGGQVLGFAAFYGHEAPCANLALLAVEAGHRQKGIGTALMRHSLGVLAQRGFTSCVLEARCSNTAALALYSRMGFNVLARRPALYARPREDGYVLQKSLTQI